MKKLSFISSLCCVVSVLSVTLAQAQNWPSFRGPLASGVSDARPLPTHWDVEKGVNLRWKTPIPGLAHSSPIVWGNRVFLTSAVAAPGPAPESREDIIHDTLPHSWRLYCLDKTTGRILWERVAHEGVPRAKRHAKASQANATPVTNGQVVVALMGSEGLFAYDFKGRLLWKRDLGLMDPGWYRHPEIVWGHAASPIIYKHLVIVQCDAHSQSFIAAYHLKNGQQVWRVERGEITTWSTPALYEGPRGAELIANGGHFIRAYDPLTGKELWRYALRPGGRGDISGLENNPHLAWHSPKGSPYTPTPVIYGDYLYACGDNGVLSVFHAKTGAQVYQERLPSSFSASPVAGDGKLFFPSEDGDVFVVKAGAKFERLATNAMGEALMATPALSDGMILLRGQRHLFAIAAR
jgi:outer membrane protein assembly factor BamB